MKSKIFYKYFLIALGWLFVAMGTIGIFVPILPTTIFFILAAWCFAKSSERFYNWLINHPRFGKFIRDYREHRGMPLKAKIIAVTMVTIAIGSSVIFFTQTMWVRILLIGIALGVSGYILSLNTIRQEQTAVSD
ncbi:MAG: YbaN family protein [Ignavibacteriales bacterium]|nr:YbaN family protein [Ignavibacteriales bacterium]